MIRGFSELSGINCLECHYKCCASEYKLPLTEREEEYITHNYFSLSLFVERHSNKRFLLRGDGCPFLMRSGLCELDQTEYKPLVCQTYPLIFWKYNYDEVLVWINPCRGNGFHWIIEKELRVSNEEIRNIFKKIKNKFSDYWGEDIDQNNPYNGIGDDRIKQEKELNLSKNEPSLLSLFAQMDFPKEYAELVSQLQENGDVFKHSYPTNDFIQIINAVLRWLCWSPVGLNLSFKNSKLIFTVAALWVKNIVNKFYEREKEILSANRAQNNLGFFLAQSILPKFWIQLNNKTKDKNLKKFALKVEKVLKGEIPQQNLISE
ncbi:MAG: YkgJ family cysteine cluster protein [Candidatus Hodarchaeales archaeon]